MDDAKVRATVTVQLTITTEVEIVDGGYLGTGATVAEHIKQAKDKVRHWQVLVKQGTHDPKPQKATFTVDRVVIVEEANRDR